VKFPSHEIGENVQVTDRELATQPNPINHNFTHSRCNIIAKLNAALYGCCHRAFCSKETVIARVLSDILTALDSREIAALALLDLSAAFDTVDHSILLLRLQRSFGLNGSRRTCASANNTCHIAASTQQRQPSSSACHRAVYSARYCSYSTRPT